MPVTTDLRVLTDWLDPDGKTYYELENLEISIHRGVLYLSVACGPDLARYFLKDLEYKDD